MKHFLLVILLNCLVRIDAQFQIPLPSEAGSQGSDIQKAVLIGVSRKDWEGPYDYEVLISGTVYIPCMKQSKTIEHAEQIYEQTRSTMNQVAILWVHQTWYNVIDPWLGDGRRSYDTLQSNPTWGSSTSPNFNQSGLHINDIEQPDNGVYACVLVRYSLELQISPIMLDKAELLSVHLLRIRSGFVVAPGCEPAKATMLQFCQTGFEKWTFNVYYPVGQYTGDFLFKGQCQSEVFLTALAIGRMNPSLWKLGWRFVPYGETDDSRAVDIQTRPIDDLHSAVELCVSDGVRPCEAELADWQKQQQEQQTQQQETLSTKSSLESAHWYSRQILRARWLLLVGSKPQKSGVWQCWIQGVATTDRVLMERKPIRFLMTEIFVHIVNDDSSHSWWRSVEVWRFLLVLSAPMAISFVFLIFCISWMAAQSYADLLPPKQSSGSAQTEFYGTSQRRVSGLFDPNKYMERFLTKSGIERYHRDSPLFQAQAPSNKDEAS